MKFGIVGVIAFIIDWGILNILVGAFHMHNVLAATISFIISLIFNYVASMKMVFKPVSYTHLDVYKRQALQRSVSA